MSNQQWPPQGNGQGNGQHSPWSRQDPNWRPPQFTDHGGRDPRKPFGAREETPSLPDLEPPKKPIWPWALGILGAVAALLAALFLIPSNEEPMDQTSRPARSAFPSPSVTGNAIPYEGNGEGVLEVTDHRWTDSGLEVDFKLTVEEGSSDFAFFTFINETRDSYVPRDDPTITVSAAEPTTGTLVFDMPRGDASLVLTTSSGRALTALPIGG